MRADREVERPGIKKGVTVELSTSSVSAIISPRKTSEDVHNSPSLSAEKKGQSSSERVQGTTAAKENVFPTTRRYSKPSEPQRDNTVSKIPHPHFSKSAASSKIAPRQEKQISTSPSCRKPASGQSNSKSALRKGRLGWRTPGAVKTGFTILPDREPARGRPASNLPPTKGSPPRAVRPGSTSPPDRKPTRGLPVATKVPRAKATPPEAVNSGSTSPPDKIPARELPASKVPQAKASPSGNSKPGSMTPPDRKPTIDRSARLPGAVKPGSKKPPGAVVTKSPSESQQRTSESVRRSTSTAVRVKTHPSTAIEPKASIVTSDTESTSPSATSEEKSIPELSHCKETGNTLRVYGDLTVETPIAKTTSSIVAEVLEDLNAIEPKASNVASGTESISPSATGEEKCLPETSHCKETGHAPRVYEDFTAEAHPIAKTTSSIVANVLEELPVKEPTLSRLGLNLFLLADESESPYYHRNWIYIETAASRVIMSSEKTSDPCAMRRILEIALARLRVNTLDVHGFPKLQALIRDREDIWEEGEKFDELLDLLLDILESPNTDTQAEEQVKTQVLMTIRLLQTNLPPYFAAFYSPRALCAIISARRNYSSSSHMVSGLEELAEVIVEQCDPEPSIDAVLDLLHTKPDMRGDGTLFTGLYILAALLHLVSEDMRSSKTLRRPLSLTPLSAEQYARLGQVAVSCLDDTDEEIWRAAMEFTLELHDASEGGEFWPLVSGTNENQRILISYYLGRRAKTSVPPDHSSLS